MFFIEQLQKDEKFIASDQIAEAVDHLTNVVAVSEQWQQFLQLLQSTLAPEGFQIIFTELPTIPVVSII